MNKEQTIRVILRIMPPRTINKNTGIDIYLLDAHQKYGEPIGELTEEQQAALDKWCDSLK
ncbi:hypothetical protein KII94_06610 [Leuconostoc gelidum subsp. gasicomitatum]|uniref:hypothetical protein n=1 Tax=Leuconostoc gasicomitatum TaxID=115778 RepID=UPI0007DEAFED|nr:hypothetical protein [Leuconostoc gasicomitatum]MBZ5960937.1 hypothetical protein [Leuconostoc gasicomitatum]MBZ5993667.1 hypothetical protein [Leuconostoc gasicomitatum]CUW04670.1 hypothetical protein PB1E_1358 [Leuconostoc gasicomitatum]